MTEQEKVNAEINRRFDEHQAELDKLLLYRWINGEIGISVELDDDD